MRTETGKAVRLSEYTVPDYLVDRVELSFQLDPHNTRIEAVLHIRPNPEGRPNAPLRLDGDDLKVIGVELDGVELKGNSADISPDGLTITEVPQQLFTLRTITEVDPAANTQLSGLYRSGGAFCTQCEAEGFRRITYFPDRPDVLSIYTTRIEADHSLAPILLGNGNPIERGTLEGGRHFAVWHDPFPKPSYLFALVGGDLASIHDTFETASGRTIALGIYVEQGKEARATYAMDALKRSMKWDEDEFGREYDLDVFNIVAVSDFNMGAMENKGLNIFNDKYILASPETATDADYAHIEAVVAHEYFHNWTGNRITCRDWFQLCLKEGLTVFRDQEFSADQRSRGVRRIEDVRALRAAQFSEDAGPLAHSVRPDTYHEINNFYTATVYQKGAEVIRMLKTLIGPDAFRKGMDIYFDRFDGTAATVEHFIQCFEEASSRDLDQFMLWYNQSGTPLIRAKGTYDATSRQFTLDIEQHLADTPGQTNKLPQVIPIRIGLLGPDGADLTLASISSDASGLASAHEPSINTFELNTHSRRIVFTGIKDKPVPSILRQFSAPVRLEYDYREADLLTLIAHDSDQFNRWQASQTYALQWLTQSVANLRAGGEAVDATSFCEALGPVLDAYSADEEFASQILTLPGENDIAREIATDVDPDAIHRARKTLRRELGRTHMSRLQAIYAEIAVRDNGAFDPRQAGIRAIRGAVLSLMAAADEAEGARLATQQLTRSKTMTDKISALSAIAQIPRSERDTAFSNFYDAYRDDALVIDKWFALQAMIADGDALERMHQLMAHPAFTMSNPNRLRSVVASFAFGNPSAFNAADGSGYDLLAGIVRDVDRRNPQVAARLLTAFKSWKSLEPQRRQKAKASLEAIASIQPLSTDVRDIVTRSLEG